MNAFSLLAVGAAVGVGAGVASARRVAPWLRSVGRLVHRGQPSHFEAVRIDDLTWRENQEHREHTVFSMKPFGHADEIGGVVMLVRYAAGAVNPSHVHTEGHGMYVLSGQLVTHKGTFGPGTFVWFPAGELMWHGATPVEAVDVVFVTGLHMTTRYPADRDAARA